MSFEVNKIYLRKALILETIAADILRQKKSSRKQMKRIKKKTPNSIKKMDRHLQKGRGKTKLNIIPSGVTKWDKILSHSHTHTKTTTCETN